MSSENKMWDEAKSQYLHQVEKALASVKNSRKKEVLDDVRSHLERRFGELRLEQQSWENIQKIITDMGPPTDYAELMDTEEKPEKEKLSLSFVGAAIIIFAIIAGLMIIFPLIYKPVDKQEFGITDFDAAVKDFNIRPYVEGGLYSAIVTIVNKGTKTLPKFRLNFYRGEPSENLNLHGKTQTGSHGAGPIETDEVWRESSSPFALNEGLNVISVVLDIDNTVKEADESNNSAELKILVENGKVIEQSPFHPTETNK